MTRTGLVDVHLNQPPMIVCVGGVCAAVLQAFGIAKTQPELDFIDVALDRDSPLFVDPFAISQRPVTDHTNADARILRPTLVVEGRFSPTSRCRHLGRALECEPASASEFRRDHIPVGQTDRSPRG